MCVHIFFIFVEIWVKINKNCTCPETTCRSAADVGVTRSRDVN